jgi:lipoate-protein ligase A
MKWLELTLPTAAENLALDEALLIEAEAAGSEGDEVFRVWEPQETFVVLGRSSRRADEVRLDFCHRQGIGVYRRASGGSAVLAGPGCLMYAVVLGPEVQPALAGVAQAHEYVLSRNLAALRPHCPQVAAAGTSDLALGGRKFSGNSLRCLRDHVLYHGTILYDFPLEQIDRCLRMPSRQPAYRAAREHADFLVNLPLGRQQILAALRSTWQAAEPLADWPRQSTRLLALEKYATAAWNEKL